MLPCFYTQEALLSVLMKDMFPQCEKQVFSVQMARVEPPFC